MEKKKVNMGIDSRVPLDVRKADPDENMFNVMMQTTKYSILHIVISY